MIVVRGCKYDLFILFFQINSSFYRYDVKKMNIAIYMVKGCVIKCGALLWEGMVQLIIIIR